METRPSRRPAEELAALVRAQRAEASSLNGAEVARAIYLGADDAPSKTRSRLWAESLTSGPTRATRASGESGASLVRRRGVAPEQIDAFLRGDRGRACACKSLESLPPRGRALRSVEMFGDRVALKSSCTTRRSLDEEDIFAAAFLVYGKSDGPLAQEDPGPGGWFLAPGPIRSTARRGRRGPRRRSRRGRRDLLRRTARAAPFAAERLPATASSP